MIIRGNFSDFFFETALPAMRAIVRNQYKLKRKMYRDIFDIDTSDRSIEQFSQMSGVGLAAEITEAGEVRTDQPVQGFDSLFKHRKFGLAVEMSQDMVEDDKWGLVRQITTDLADAVDETIEIDAASTLNNAFSGSFLGPDAVALCSASHPQVKAGGVQSNILSVPADLDVTSLELALTDWETLKRSNGYHASLPTPRLLAAPANRWNAHEMLKGSWRSDTANRTINAFQHGENGPIDQILIWAKLTDPDAWFLLAPPAQTGLKWFWRRRPYQQGFADDRTERGGNAIRYKKSHGWNDYLGVYGTPGA